MTRKQVAKALGLSERTVGLIEREAIAKVKALLKERGINIKDLLND